VAGMIVEYNVGFEIENLPPYPTAFCGSIVGLCVKKNSRFELIPDLSPLF
jgi:hypothetical protein